MFCFSVAVRCVEQEAETRAQAKEGVWTTICRRVTGWPSGGCVRLQMVEKAQAGQHSPRPLTVSFSAAERIKTFSCFRRRVHNFDMQQTTASFKTEALE